MKTQSLTPNPSPVITVEGSLLSSIVITIDEID
jgi:hypothetical protein